MSNGCPNCASLNCRYPNPTDAGPELTITCTDCGTEYYEPNPQSRDYRDARDEAQRDDYRRYW